MEEVKKELQRIASEGAELGLKYAERKGKPYLLIPLFEGFDIAATLPSMDEKVVLKACIKKDGGIEGVYGKGNTCRHSVINYEEVYGTTGKKLGEQKVELRGIEDLGAFLMSWDAWKQYGNQYGEVLDPQIITQLIDKVPKEKRPLSALKWFEEKTFNDLEEILKWDKPDYEFQKSRRGQALYVLGRMLSIEAVEHYIPVHFLDLVKEKLDKYMPLFLDVLKEGDENEKLGCARALEKMGEKALPTLTQGLKDEDWYVRLVCAGALGEIGSEKAMPCLAQGLKDKNGDVRWACARALANIGEKAIPCLAQGLKDKDYDMKTVCAYMLGGTGSEKAIPCLAQGLKDKHWEVRDACAYALGNLANEEAIPALEEGLKDKNHWVRRACTSALEKIEKKTGEER